MEVSINVRVPHEVEWNTLSQHLMQQVLEIPYKIERLERHLDSIDEFDDGPDHATYFEARQFGYCELGLKIVKLEGKLRHHAGISSETPAPDQFDIVARLAERMDELAEARRLWQERQAAYQASATPLPPIL